MYIRKATPDDLTDIMPVYARARSFMAEHGNPNQWAAKNHPPLSLIEQDIQKEKFYVCMDGDILAGVFYFDQGIHVESDYNAIDGEWIGSSTYGVVHRIAASGKVKGAGAFCLNWAFEQCRDLRIDTHHDNTVMQNLLNKLGFHYCGVITLAESGEPRLAYEKI